MLDQVFACLIHHISVKYKGNEHTNKTNAKVVIKKSVELSLKIMEPKMPKMHDHGDGKQMYFFRPMI